jgi:Zn-dependent protease with chaperone function
MAVIHSQNAFMEKLNNLCLKVSLSDENFEAMSKQAERELKDNRHLYMFKVMTLAALGYAFIFLVVAVLLLVLFLCIQLLIYSHVRAGGIKILILVLIPLYFIGKSLWLKVPEPTGLDVTADDAPELFALLDELSAKLHTRVDKVLLDHQYNAAVIQIPRLGLLGFYKNIVMIGLPLMLTQRPLQFKAILAHELGHLSGNHSRSSAWIYKLRGRWANLLATIGEAGSLFCAVFLVFFSWFSPRFSAYSLALARAHELEADANAAKIAGVENFTKCMLTLPVYGKFLGKSFWPDVQELIKTTPTAPDDVFVRMKNRAAIYCPEQEGLDETLKEALGERASGTDTHPPLKVRLLDGYFEPALTLRDNGSGNGLHPPLKVRLMEGTFEAALTQNKSVEIPQGIFSELAHPIATEDSAAYRYLGQHLDSTLVQLGRRWQKDMAEGWKHEHSLFLAAVESLNQLEKKATETGLTIEELKLKAYLVGETQNNKACIAVYHEILALSPQETGIRYNLGMMLLEEDFEAGLKHLTDAIGARSTLLPQACPKLLPLLKETGRHAEAEALECRLAEYHKEAALAQKERLSVNGESLLEPHGLQADDLSYLQTIFVQLPSVQEAYVVRKFVRHLPDCPYLVIGLEMKAKARGAEGVQENLALAQWLIGNLQLPYEFCVSTFDMHTGKLKKNIVAMDDSLVYHK